MMVTSKRNVDILAVYLFLLFNFHRWKRSVVKRKNSSFHDFGGEVVGCFMAGYDRSF